MRIVAYGLPGPQGSKRHVGKGVMIESSKKVKPWREAVKLAALDIRSGAPPIDAPVEAVMVFTVVRPRSHYRSGRNAHLLREGAPARPGTTPDLSKLARSTEDALTEAGVWRDDALLVEYARLAKVYANEDPDALDSPGVVIDVRPITKPAMEADEQPTTP